MQFTLQYGAYLNGLNAGMQDEMKWDEFEKKSADDSKQERTSRE